jgi:hypothetical protein
MKKSKVFEIIEDYEPAFTEEEIKKINKIIFGRKEINNI